MDGNKIMKLTKQTLYRLIIESLEHDPEPKYANLYDPTQPMALLHHDGDTEQSFYLYHLTNNPRYPVFVIAYLSMEVLGDDDKKCIPYTFHVLGTYTELKARRRGFSRTLYDVAFYIASKYKNQQGKPYGLTSDQFSGTTDVADTAAWSKYEQSSNYYKRKTALGNDVFDYTGNLTPDDKDDDCETYTDKVATSHSFQKTSHGDISQLYIELVGSHNKNSKTNNLKDRITVVASDRFFYYYGQEIS